MYKFIFLSCLFLAPILLNAQIRYGTYVRTAITYSDNSEPEDTYPGKYSYVRYTFQKGGKGRLTMDFRSKGSLFQYTQKNNHLILKADEGYILNEFLVEKCTDSELILLQKGLKDFNGPDCLRLYFQKEELYQKDFNPSPDDIHSVSANDTIFISSEKVYPQLKGDKDHYHFLEEGLPKQPSANLLFLATFIVSKEGTADSLNIIESISPEFDKHVVKNFNKIRANWWPAYRNNKPVSCQMQLEFRYLSSDVGIQNYHLSSKGNSAIAAGKFDLALEYFSKAVDLQPYNKEMVLKRALCKYELGDIEGARRDLEIVKLLGNRSVSPLLKKWSNQ